MTYLDDDLDDLMDDEETDYDDDELYSDTLDESEYKEDLIDRIKDIIEYYGFEFEESTFDEMLEEAYEDCVYHFEELLDEYRDIEDALYDDSLEDEIYQFLDACTDDYRKEEEEDDPVQSENGSDDSREMKNDEDINVFFDKGLKYSRDSIFFKGYNVSEDDKGKRIGYKRKSLFNDDITKYYDEKNEFEGYSRKSFWISDRTNYYDKKGKKIGYSRKSLIDDSYTEYFDTKGNLVGYSRKDLFTGKYQIYKKKK